MRCAAPAALVCALALAACGATDAWQAASSGSSAAASSAAGTSVPADSAEVRSDSAETSADTERPAIEEVEMYIEHGDDRIYGRLYLPRGSSRYASAAGLPLVVCSHGFGGNLSSAEPYARALAGDGIAAFAFDFVGGGYGGRSGGDMRSMSVLTEAADLGAVLDFFRSYDGIDPARIFLLGESQGGFVSAYVAGTRPDDVAGLVLLYPAFVLQDDSRARNPDPSTGAATQTIMGMTVGRVYDVDAQSFDIYDVIAGYPGQVLIVHGTADPIVPVSYSERAAATFPHARLVEIDGAGHGFSGSARRQATSELLAFVGGLASGADADGSGVAGASGQAVPSAAEGE